MLTSIYSCTLPQKKQTLQKRGPATPILNVLLISSLLLYSAKSVGQSANLDQGQNGSATSRTTPVKWVNGDLNPSNAHFAEGYSIPYRMVVSSLNSSLASHTLIIEWDTKDQNGHALDYITHYQNLDNPAGSHQFNYGHAPEAVDPTVGTAFSGSPMLYQILTPSSTGAEKPGQPAASFGSLPSSTGNADATKMAIWGGTIIGMAYVNEDNQDATTASTKTSLSITFTLPAGATSALLAWGGHIAAEYDWGTGRGASEVNGSPYHMRLISIDGKGGNQDRGLKATAVLVAPPPCAVTAAQSACEGTSTTLTYSFTGSTSGITNYSWTLSPGTSGAKISGTAAGVNTVSGAGLTSVNIVPSGTGYTVGSFTLQLTTTNVGGDGTPCSTGGTITANPGRPAVSYIPPECDQTTFSVKITSPTDGTYTLTQDAGGVGPIEKKYPEDKDANGNIIFSGLTVGKGFSVVLKVGDCTSDATDCANYKTTPSSAARTTSTQAESVQTVNAKIEAQKSTVLAAPNPFTSTIKFSLESAVSGQGSLELYNMLGQKVRTVYQGFIQKGQVMRIDYNVPSNLRTNLVYIFRVGDQKVTGKLVGLK